ncbi:histidine phosphatase family protein [Pseudobdellovibrio exovorus]|uniref:Histidine phosphatase family protein n=1 Tax=Pseudobdellovibrio exovorus JSS TaxID=1184267 RepID=M4V5D8_9BACT|nr:histidine phosphatase family protein [Pseudobdellovibrio exovorus]AGH94542.1 hypothetical protein A11Q_322 [Pseudobdellovibrio exovorus JSS]
MRSKIGFIYILSAVIQVSSLLSPNSAWAEPSDIYVIRHAEKPNDDSQTHLSKKGYERAQALVQVFSSENSRFKVPQVIVAQHPRKKKGSIRSIETAAPLAESLGLEVDTSFEVKDALNMARHVLSSDETDGKVVLIVWGHDEIPDIAKAFGAKNLSYWRSQDFDRVWYFKFRNGKLERSENLPMQALPGDSKK